MIFKQLINRKFL